MYQEITSYAVYTEQDYRTRSDLIYPPELQGGMWEPFMQEDPISNQYWSAFHEVYASYQLYIADDKRFIARIKCVPVRHDGALSDLPLTGWDWAIENSMAIHQQGIAPNMVSALEITILPAYRGTGLSTTALKLMRLLIARQGFDTLIAPVRPNQKHHFPLIPMDEYIQWRRADGLPYDAWLRTHERIGGEIVKVAPASMRIPGTIAQWREWTGLEFPGSGQYLVPQALNPIQIDLAADEGVYIEPNVWIAHPVTLA
ncbi:MAG: N-acetyltransferase [Anaerolineae bacterium]